MQEANSGQAVSLLLPPVCDYNAPGSLTRLKNDPSAVNISVLLNDVTSPIPASAANQGPCSKSEEAPCATEYSTGGGGGMLKYMCCVVP